MKRFWIMISMLVVLFSLTACKTVLPSGQDKLANSPDTQASGVVMGIELVIGNKTFYASLYQNETASAFLQRLPLELAMGELNGNEKYCYLSDALPTNAGDPAEIRAGDLMLYGDNCLVLFYENFSTSYSYTPIGRVDDSEGLAAALGDGNVQIRIKAISLS